MFWIITILILIIAGVILLPGIIIAHKVYSLKRQFTKQYGAFVREQQRESKAPNTDINHREKVFDDSVGEYVEFEDIPADEYNEEEYESEEYPDDEMYEDGLDSDDYYDNEYESESEEYYYQDDESQVEDAEWEDV